MFVFAWVAVHAMLRENVVCISLDSNSEAYYLSHEIRELDQALLYACIPSPKSVSQGKNG